MTAANAKSHPSAECTDQCATIGTEHYGGNGCVFHMDRYASKLVYLAQLRASWILQHDGRVGNSTSQYMAVSKLSEVQTVLNKYKSQLLAEGSTNRSATSGVALVQAQISSLQAMSNIVLRLPEVGFVPSFSRAFYTSKLKSYFETFEKLMTSLQSCIGKQELLSAFLGQ